MDDTKACEDALAFIACLFVALVYLQLYRHFKISVFFSLNYFIHFLRDGLVKLSSSNLCGSSNQGTELMYSNDSEGNLSS